MPVFTVTGREPFPKVLVNKNTIDEVVANSIIKLKLLPGDYKLLLEKNGAHIDEDDLLRALLPESELIIVPADEEWHGRNFQSPIPVTPTISTTWTRTLHDGTPRGTPQRRSSPQQSCNELSVPWSSFECVQNELESGLPLNPRSFRIIVHALANQLLAKKDYSRTSCKVLIKPVFAKHSDAFAIRDADGHLLSDGFSTFLSSLYERVNFLKPSELKKTKRKRQLIDDEDDDLLSWQHHTNPTYDAYGCVAWQPQLPEGDSSSNQKRKKARASVEDSPDNLKELMAQTYWLQRTDLNTRKGDLGDVLSLWPALKQTDLFLNHCSTLLGKNCAEVWYGALHSQGHSLFKYFDDYSAITKESSHNLNQLNSLKNLSREANTAMSQLRSKGPLIISSFMMILSYFGEKTDSIIHLVDLEGSEGTIPATDRPLLLVKGRSLFDEGVQLLIVCEGKEVLQPKTLNEAFMLHFLSFYAFNYNYPEQGRKYLEFIQRSFFKINPTKGHKRGPRNARTDVLDPNVKKLIQKFDAFSQRLTRLMA